MGINITGITWNWRTDSEGRELYDFAYVGKRAALEKPVCTKIEYDELDHNFPGLKESLTISFDNGSMIRVYNPNEVFIKEIQDE